eukprot:5420645-Amphidinium_carterae.1
MRCHRCGSTEHLISRCPMSPPPGQQQQACHSAAADPSLASSSSRPADVGHLNVGRGQQAGVLLQRSHLATMTEASQTESSASSWRVVDALSSSWRSAATTNVDVLTRSEYSNPAPPYTSPPAAASPWSSHQAAAEQMFNEMWSRQPRRQEVEYPSSSYPFSAGAHYQTPIHSTGTRSRATSAPARAIRRETSRQVAANMVGTARNAQNSLSVPTLPQASMPSYTGPPTMMGALQGVTSAVQVAAGRRTSRSAQRPPERVSPHPVSFSPPPRTESDGASDTGEALEEPPVHFYGDTSQCALCLLDFEAHQRVCRIPCRHVFHVACFEQLMSHHISGQPTNPYPRCPNCRGSGRVVATWNYVSAVSLETPRAPTTPPPRSPAHSDAEQFSTPQPESNSIERTFAWMPTDLTYMASTTDNVLGLLVDPGSWGNLSGDRWVAEAGRRSEKTGGEIRWEKRLTTLRVGGVGKTTDEVEYNATVPVTLCDAAGAMEEGAFKTLVLSQSQCPALLGLQSLTQLGAVLDVRGKMLHMCGDKEVELNLPAGSRSYPLHQAESGHLLLRVDHYDQAAKAKQAAALAPTFHHLLADHLEPPASSNETPSTAKDVSDERPVPWKVYAAFRKSPKLMSRCCQIRCPHRVDLARCSNTGCFHSSCKTHAEVLGGKQLCSCCADDYYLSKDLVPDHTYENEPEDAAANYGAADPTSSTS